MGVSNSLLDAQRRVAAALASPGAGSGGQNLDLALFIADDSAYGRADPAYAAHMGVIGEWASAVWERRLPLISMDKMVCSAKQKIAKAKPPWACCCGPAAA